VERAWVATIDAFCARLLRENAIEAGLAPDFAVLDEGSAKRMQREAAEQALDELFQERPAAMRRLLEGLALSTGDDERQVDLAASLLEVLESMRLAGVRVLPDAAGSGEDVLPEARRLAAEIGREPAWSHLHDWIREFLGLDATPVTRSHFEVLARFKANLVGKKKARDTVKRFRDVVLPQLAEQWILAWHSGLPELLREAVARLDRDYREAKRREAAVDFADLEELAIELLESHPELRERIANQFDHVLMDELQDTNRLQWKLIGLVRRKNFFAVGDINQSIYGFRHADRTVFAGYRNELRERGLNIDELKENYRSRPEILASVSHVLEGREGVEPRELISKRKLVPQDHAVVDQAAVERLVGTGERAAEAEAELVAARIAEGAREGRQWGDFAILVRALHSAEPFEKALTGLGIPFLVSGGRTFLEARETLDLMALLAAMVNPLDEIATAGVLRGPLVGWSDERLLAAGPDGRRQEFERLFGRARKLAGFIAPDRLLATTLDECGYAAGLNDRGRANIDKLFNWIRRELRGKPRPLAKLLEDLEGMRTARVEAEAPAQQAADAVNIMTIHAAKGLEFPVVFVSALHAGRRNSTPVLLFSADLGLGVKWRNPVTGENQKDATHAALSERRKGDESAEEDRLLYVAMTRAEDRLVLSYARQQRRSQWQKDAEKGIHAETEADRAAEIHGAPSSRFEAANRETLLDAATVGGQHDSSAAVTDVALFAACPRKYYLARYVGWTPAPTGPGTGAIELGLEAHKALAGQPVELPEALELGRRFKESELGQRAARAERVEREFDFLLAVDDVVLRGQIDLWFEEGGELTLVDYKTDRDESGAAEYALQLRLYALALERYAGRRPDRASLCFLQSGGVVDISVSSTDLEAARIAVRGLAAAQNSLEFPTRAGEQCRRCSFYEGLCPVRLPS
jgi:ATP-dependent exoDNAse (exonuclease V) beta subunit